MNRKQLRRHIRQRRRALTPQQQVFAARQWSDRANRFAELRLRRHIAVYLAFDGEMQLQPWIKQAWRRGQQIYLPVLHPVERHRVWFVRYQPHSVMRKNRFGIIEPDPKFNRRLPAWCLNIICLPLVAYDRSGNRLGMGGGFYDRLLEDLHSRSSRPITIGCAHRLQQVDCLPTEAWDQPVDFIITDEEIISIKK